MGKEGQKLVGNSSSLMEVDGAVGKRINFWKHFAVGQPARDASCCGRFGTGSGGGALGLGMVLG